MRLLLVEDDERLAGYVRSGLHEAGYAVDHAADGASGLRMALASDGYDAAVVDLMLPELDGLSLIERLRAQGSTLPVLILSAKREVDDRVAGLRTGGDDYLTKPFAFTELVARIEALVRRSAARGEPTQLVMGPLVLDLIAREFTRDGEPVLLQPREFDLLRLLLRNAGRVVSRAMILEELWGYSFDPGTNAVDVLVHRLRKKLHEGGEPRLFTIRGAGFVLRAP